MTLLELDYGFVFSITFSFFAYLIHSSVFDLLLDSFLLHIFAHASRYHYNTTLYRVPLTYSCIYYSLNSIIAHTNYRSCSKIYCNPTCRSTTPVNQQEIVDRYMEQVSAYQLIGIFLLIYSIQGYSYLLFEHKILLKYLASHHSHGFLWVERF